MRRTPIVVARIALAGLAGAAAFAQQKTGEAGEAPAEGLTVLGEPVTTEQIELGRQLYGANCASCHGAQGEGTDIALSLNNPVFLETASDGFLYHALVQGRRDTAMASYQGRLDDQTLRDLVALIRSWQQEP